MFPWRGNEKREAREREKGSEKTLFLNPQQETPIILAIISNVYSASILHN